MSESLKIGQIITSPQFRDAIHVAVAPMLAGTRLYPGQSVNVNNDATQATPANAVRVGIVDPYLQEPVERGQQFWLFLIPGSVTSLAHVWTHPAFSETASPPSTPKAEEKSDSEKWMMKWAKRYMSEDYYGDEGRLSDEVAYANAIRAGEINCVFCYESASDHINDEWWDHWENITGKKGNRDSYFSCAC